MSDDASKSPRGNFNQIQLQTVFGIVAIACIFLAITRSSIAASIIVVVTIMAAIGGIFLRQVRGEIVVLLMLGIPLLILAIGVAVGVLMLSSG